MIAEYYSSGRYTNLFRIPFDIKDYKKFLDEDEHCEDLLNQYLSELSDDMIGDGYYDSEDSGIDNWPELDEYIKEQLNN